MCVECVFVTLNCHNAPSQHTGEVQRLMAPQDKDAVTYRRRQAARDFLRACSGDIYLAMSMLAFAAKNR